MIPSIVSNTTIRQPVIDFATGEILSPEGGLILHKSNSAEMCTAPNRPVMKAVNRTTGEIVYFRPVCKTWGCPTCGRIRKWLWVTTAQLGARHFIEIGLSLDFLTITSHEELDENGTFGVMGDAWNKLWRRVKRETARHDYFNVPEQHQDGRWHCHAITTAILKKKWWKDNARESGFGYQVDVRPVKSEAAAAKYSTKYLTKSLESANLPKHYRRVRLSRGWPELPAMTKPEGWLFAILDGSTPFAWDVARYQAEGFQVVLADAESAWDWISG